MLKVYGFYDIIGKMMNNYLESSDITLSFSLTMDKMRAYILIIISLTLVGCGVIEKTEEILMPKGNDLEKIITEKKTVSLSCNRGDIKEYLEKGWKVIKTEVKEVPCSWKTKKSTRGCNIDRYKGCKITIPDKMGSQTKYILEKESIIKE